MSEGFDIGVIGAGPGGYVAAIRAAQLGARVVVVEKGRLGGVCMNLGCIPTKAMARSIELLMEIERVNEFGVMISEPGFDFPTMMRRKDKVVSQLVSGIESLMQARRVEVIYGRAELVSPTKIRIVGECTREVEAAKIVVATGAVPVKPPAPGVELSGVVTSNEIIFLEEVPCDLVIVGGGVIGVEFASIFNALGTKVTVIEMLSGILPPVDEELSRRYLQLARRQGVVFHLSSCLTEIRRLNGLLEARYEGPNGDGGVNAEMVLVSTGRVPYTEGLNLGGVGITTEGEAIAVDEYMSTGVPGVYAIGDVTGGWMLAHVASREGEVAAENALVGASVMDYRAVPNCVFTIPEIGVVGLTEQQAKERGIPYRKSRFPFSASGRALAIGETTGLVKMICEAETRQVLGLHILGPHATDLVAEGALAIQLGATAEDVIRTIHAHPTLPETVRETALGQVDGPIHALG